MAGEIVVGFDGTDGADAALDTAISMAADSGAKLLVTYCYEPYHGAGDVGPHRAALKEMGQKTTAEGVEKAKARGVEAEAALVANRPASGMADLAAESGARCIVVGTYGDKPLRAAVLGEAPHKLLAMSPVPVVVVPIPD